MDLSILIVNYNSASYLKRALASLRFHLKGLAYEICVIDNASTDHSTEILKDDSSLIAIFNRTNVGFAAAINQGLERTYGKYVLWFNPDAELQNDGLIEAIDYLQENSSIGILGLRIVNPDGTVQLSCRSFPTYFAAFFNRYSIFTRLFPRNFFSRRYLQNDWDHSAIRDVDWVSGACLLHRRELIESIGALDESYFMYCEDVDFCRRAHQKGWSVQYHPAALISHAIAGSSRLIKMKMIVERHKSIWHYYSKHFSRNPIKDAAIAAGIWTRCSFLLAANGFKRLNNSDKHIY